MSAQHTPGPWSIDRAYGDCCVAGRDGDRIAAVYGYDYGEDEANAALIAAAPDLLAACQAVLDEFPAADGRRIESVKALCRAALRKAGVA